VLLRRHDAGVDRVGGPNGRSRLIWDIAIVGLGLVVFGWLLFWMVLGE